MTHGVTRSAGRPRRRRPAAGRACPGRAGRSAARGPPVRGWPRPAAWRRPAACPSPRPACGARPCARRRHPAPPRSPPPAPPPPAPGACPRKRQLRAEQAHALGVRADRRARAGAVLHVGEHLRPRPVAGSARPGVAGRASAATRAARTRASASAVGIHGDRALLAVEQDGHPVGDVVEPADRDDAGQPQLPGDDRGVAGGPPRPRGQADHPRRVQPGGVGGRQVVGEQHRRQGGVRDARLALSGELGDDPVPDVTDVGDPLGHQPTERGEHVHELLGGLRPWRRRPGARVDPLLDRRRQATVRTSPTWSTSTSAPPRSRTRPAGQPPGHGVAAATGSAPSSSSPAHPRRSLAWPRPPGAGRPPRRTD